MKKEVTLAAAIKAALAAQTDHLSQQEGPTVALLCSVDGVNGSREDGGHAIDPEIARANAITIDGKTYSLGGFSPEVGRAVTAIATGKASEFAQSARTLAQTLPTIERWATVCLTEGLLPLEPTLLEAAKAAAQLPQAELLRAAIAAPCGSGSVLADALLLLEEEPTAEAIGKVNTLIRRLISEASEDLCCWLSNEITY